MKNRLIRGIMAGLLLLSIAISGCMEKKDNRVVPVWGTEEETTGNSGKDTEENIQQAKPPIEDLDEAYNLILNYCNREFIGNHPVDEAFLGWVRASFGEEVIEGLVEEVTEGEQDVECWHRLTGNTVQVLWLMYCRETGFESYQLDNVYWKECADSEKTVLDFTGDINFAEGWGTTEHMDAQPGGIYDCFSEELLNEMRSADIMMINNEFTYSNRGEPLAGKSYTFRAKPERAGLLAAFGTDLVSLANNHTYDYGEEALLDTLDTLEQEGIPYVGAGRNLDEAKKIVYFVAGGRKIAITAATQIERSLNYTREATEDSAGVLKTLDPDKYVRVIQEAKRNSDLVIAFVHWGTENVNQYGPDQERLADAFVEAGADVIIGGHTHCLQGFSYKEGVPIIYSLGNFWFSQSTLDTGLSQVIIEKDGSIRFRFLPCIQKGYRTSLVTEAGEKQRILDYMERISNGVSIDADGYVTELSDEN